MKILLYGLNYSPEEIGIGKYSSEMVASLADLGCQVSVVTTPPYYPQWKIGDGFSGRRYTTESNGTIEVTRCPLWVPKRVNGWKRIIHLASFGLSSFPVVIWKAISTRPDVVIVIEPAVVCLPAAWLAARLCGAKAWLHVQDFEVDAAFELGILKQPLLKKLVLALEAFWMRRFDRVSSISPNMVSRLLEKGVTESQTCFFPNWVDCTIMRPLDNHVSQREQFGISSDKCVALYAGNIGSKQGLEIIVEAATLAKNRPEIHFVICGRGATYEELAESVSDLPNVQLLPVQPMERFNELMNAADIHMLPQREDAADLVMPSKLTGMLATGRPVVASANRGTQISEVLEGHGLVVPPGNADAFYQAIVKLAENETLRKTLSDAARLYAVQHLSKAAILGRFEYELRRLIGSGAVESDDAENLHRPTPDSSSIPANSRARGSRPRSTSEAVRS